LVIAVAIVVGCCCTFAAAGAFVGILYCCSRWPDSNLAGLVGIFEGSRIGLAVGASVGIAILIWRSLRTPSLWPPVRIRNFRPARDDGMSDEPKKRSHTVRLAVSMVLGAFAGAVFVPLVGGTDGLAPLICTASGALVGLAVEMRRRFLEPLAYPGHEGTSDEARSVHTRQMKSAMLNRLTGFGMFLGAAGAFIAALVVTDSQWKLRGLFLSLASLFGTVGGGILGLLFGSLGTLFVRSRHHDETDGRN
jgi:hypothetical protein